MITTIAHRAAAAADVDDALDDVDEVTRQQVAGITAGRMRAHLDRYPTAPIPPERTALVFLNLARFDGQHPMVGETTAVAGLVLVPHVIGQPVRFSGLWDLTHQRSGMRVSPPAAHVYAREAAVWLAGAGIDWDRPTDDVGTDPAAALAAVDLARAVERARADRRPLAYARTSWVDWPPLWRVCRDGRVSDPGFFTYEGAADFADAACAPADLSDGLAPELLHPDAVIHRDAHSPGWALCCAAVACQDREMWLLDDYDDGAPTPWIGNRAAIASAARADGWREHDRAHWTCPPCTALYR